MRLKSRHGSPPYVAISHNSFDMSILHDKWMQNILNKGVAGKFLQTMDLVALRWRGRRRIVTPSSTLFHVFSFYRLDRNS